MTAFKRLFYRNADKMMSVPTTLAPELVLGRPKLLFNAPYEGIRRLTATNYDVAEDGRFLMVRSEEDRAKHTLRINVVLNWFEELKARVPTKKEKLVLNEMLAAVPTRQSPR